MKALTLLWMSFFGAPPTVAPPAPAAASAPAPDVATQVVEGIQAFYAGSKDLKAKFTQTYTYKVHDRSQVSSGLVFFKKPRMMRWDYQKPQSKLFVADGATLWVYEPEESQVFKRSLEKSQLPIALTFMTGEGRLLEEFTVKLLQAPDEKHFFVELVPKRDEGEYKALRLLVDRATYAVRASTVVDPVGNTNHVEFAEVQTNVGLPDQGFRFQPPAGVRVVSDNARTSP